MKSVTIFLTVLFTFISVFSQNFIPESGIEAPGKRDTLFTDLDGDVYIDKLITREDGTQIYLKNLGFGEYVDVIVNPDRFSHEYVYTPANPDSQYFVDETAERLPVIYDLSLSCDVGDIDGDGDLDIIVGNAPSGVSEGGQNHILINDGNGYFIADDNRIPLQYQDTRAAPFGDVDNDGDLDIYVANHRTGGPNMDYSDRIWINNGTGFFSDETDNLLPLTDSLNIGARFGDFNNDGWLDIFLGHSGTNIFNLVYINNGNGTFSDQTSLWLPEDNWGRKIYMFDVNQDWNPDVIYTKTGDKDRMLIHDGISSLIDETDERFPNPIDYTYDMATGDIDNDGDIDIFCTNPTELLIWINNNGYFIDESENRIPLPGPYIYGSSSMMGDLDGDGDLDLFMGTFNVTPHRLYINDGNGYFTDGSESWLPPVSSSNEDSYLFDADSDGDLDIFLANNGSLQNQLFINHLDIPDTIPPRINRTTNPPLHRDSLLIFQTEVWDNMIHLSEVNLYYRTEEDASFTVQKMWAMGGFLYRTTLPYNLSDNIYYYIEAVDRMENISYDPSGAPDSVYSTITVGVSAEQFSMYDINKVYTHKAYAYPNPFNYQTIISFYIEKLIFVEIDIYDISGRYVRSFTRRKMDQKKMYTISWNGTNSLNEKLSSGIYFVIIKWETNYQTLKLVLLN